MIDQIKWLGHGSFVIDNSAGSHDDPQRLYINPWRIARTEPCADVILITSDRFDRCSPSDIEKLRTSRTRLIAPASAGSMLPGCEILRPWQIVSINRLCIKAVPAYHPSRPSENGLGFVISLPFYDIYYAGDTGMIPELEHVRPDVALLPIDGGENLTPDEAAEAAVTINARWVIPYNWGTNTVNASRLDALSLSRLLKGRAETVLLSPTRSL